MDAQIRKGLLEFCVLAALREGDSYGYQMMKDISGHVAMSESTLYPILRRLEMGGKVEAYAVEHNGRLRKYFHMTDKGRGHLDSFVEEREEIMRLLDYIGGPADRAYVDQGERTE